MRSVVVFPHVRIRCPLLFVVFALIHAIAVSGVDKQSTKFVSTIRIERLNSESEHHSPQAFLDELLNDTDINFATSLSETTMAPTAEPTQSPSADGSESGALTTTPVTPSPSAMETTRAPTESPTQSVNSGSLTEIPTIAPTDSSISTSTTLPTSDTTEASSTGSPSKATTTTPSTVYTDAPNLTTDEPSLPPTAVPTHYPTVVITTSPTVYASVASTAAPTEIPTVMPSVTPSEIPTWKPSISPSATPSEAPTADPSTVPSTSPSLVPSEIPSWGLAMVPSVAPSVALTAIPSMAPSVMPSMDPSEVPTMDPSISPSAAPSVAPSEAHTADPSMAPSVIPTKLPTEVPSEAPSVAPTTAFIASPLIPTSVPSDSPTPIPSMVVLDVPVVDSSAAPSVTSVDAMDPSAYPSASPTDTLVFTYDPTPLPSLQPSNSPSAFPTELSTEIPSKNNPSLDLTLNPTASPTVAPSAVVSDVPTVSPTEVSSEVPTNFQQVTDTESPTDSWEFRPTIPPTAAPTMPSWNDSSSPPTESRTMSPTTAPTVVPTDAPTVAPTTAPSFLISPTSFPTNALFTLAPSVAPTTKPTEVITLSPIATPTISPTAAPTLTPTQAPSLSPTLSPSLSPTWSPTASPTIKFHICTAENNTITILHNLLSLPYTASFLMTNKTLTVPAQSNIQISLMNFSLTLQTLSTGSSPYQVSITYYVASCDTLLDYSVMQSATDSCSSQYEVSLIWYLIMGKRGFSVDCGGNLWIGKQCDAYGTYRICTNCDDPCTSTILNAYGSNTVRATVVSFSVQSNKQLWPQWTQTVKSTSDKSITIEYELQGWGRLYCAALPTGLPIYSQSSISTTSNLVVADSLNSSLVSTGELTIGGLASNTIYNVACFTRGWVRSTADQYRSPMSVVLNKINSNVQTNRPLFVISTLTAQLSFASLLVGSSAASLTLSVDVLPANSNVTIVPSFQRICSSLCSSVTCNETSSSAIVSGTNGVVAPLSSMFARSKLQDEFYVEPSDSGCYSLSFTIFPRGNNFRLAVRDNAKNDVSRFFLRSNSSRLELLVNVTSPAESSGSSIILVSAIFSPLGSDFTILLSADSDAGLSIGVGLAKLFACSRIFTFPTSETATCQFLTSRSVYVTLASSVNAIDLPVPGDVIVLKENALRQTTQFQAELWLASSSVVLQRSTQNSVKAVITASTQSSVGQDLTLSIASSAGNGGRRWAHIQWKVFVNYSSSSTAETAALTTFLNGNQLKWQNCEPFALVCDTIPGAFFSSPGVYSFELTLTNFLGYSATISKSVTVSSKVFVPRVWLIGPTYAVMTSNVSLILRVEIPSNMCGPVNFNSSSNANDLDSDDVTINWIAYRDDVVDVSLANLILAESKSNRDPRSLLIPADTLKPGHEYRVGVAVVCGMYYAYDETSRFISSNDVLASIRDGSIVSRSIAQSLTFDASSSTKVYNDQTFDLVYRWSCVQIKPLVPTGCDAFNNISLNNNNNNNVLTGDNRNSSSSTDSMAILTIDNGLTVFQPSAEYVVTVTVFSSSLGIYRQAHQHLRTLPLHDDGDGDVDGGSINNSTSGVTPLPLIYVTTPPVFTVNNSFGYTVNASVVGSTSFVAEWQLLGDGQVSNATHFVLSTQLFLQNNSVDSPSTQLLSAILPNSLLTTFSLHSLQSLTLRLLAFPFDDRTYCLSSHCVDQAALVSSEFTVLVNQAPRWGCLSVSPLSGLSQTTTFTIFANNWFDEDSPLYYAFYVWNAVREDWDLLRHRMQLSAVSTYLVAGVDCNGTNSNDTAVASSLCVMPLRVLVSDYYGASAAATTTVSLRESTASVLASGLVVSMRRAAIAVDLQNNPEISLPLIGEALQVLSALQCATLASEECQVLLDVTSSTLLSSLTKYNAGFVTISGLISYLNGLLEVSSPSNLLNSTVFAYSDAYIYLSKAMLSIGFSVGDGEFVLRTMFSMADTLITLLTPSNSSAVQVCNNADECTRQWVNIQQVVSDLQLLYFSALPFNEVLTFSSNSHFNVSLVKIHWPSWSVSNQFSKTVPSTTSFVVSSRASSDPVAFLMLPTKMQEETHSTVRRGRELSTTTVTTAVQQVGEMYFSNEILPVDRTTSVEYRNSLSFLPQCRNVSMIQSRVLEELLAASNVVDNAAKDDSLMMTVVDANSVTVPAYCIQGSESKSLSLTIHRQESLVSDAQVSILFRRWNETIDVAALSSVSAFSSSTAGSTGPSTSAVQSSTDATLGNVTYYVDSSGSLELNCSSFSTSTRVVCDSTLTNGVTFTFPSQECPLNRWNATITFVCPTFQSTLLCLVDGHVVSERSLTNATLSTTSSVDSTVYCDFNVSMLLSRASSSSSSSGSGDSAAVAVVSGDFSTAQSMALWTPPAIVVSPSKSPSHSSKAGGLSKASTINYIALVVLVTAGIGFGIFMYHRMQTAKLETAPELMPALPTTASIVSGSITVDVDIDVDLHLDSEVSSITDSRNGSGGSVSTAIDDNHSQVSGSVDGQTVDMCSRSVDLEIGDVHAELIQFDAVAFPVLM